VGEPLAIAVRNLLFVLAFLAAPLATARPLELVTAARHYRYRHGVDPLLNLFDKHGVSDRIVPQRPSVV